MNPKMKNQRLRTLFDEFGFTDVQTVISSGNVVFDARSRNIGSLEATIEKALPTRLGFSSTTIVRSRDQLQSLVDQDPFGSLEDGPSSRLNVTFLKRPSKVRLTFPYRAEDGSFELLGLYEGAVCSATDLSRLRTPDLMGWLEKTYGKEVTTRTWKTVGRILRALG